MRNCSPDPVPDRENTTFPRSSHPRRLFPTGCDTGQDNEKPVHHVWVDEFLLADHQVTNTEDDTLLARPASLTLSRRRRSGPTPPSTIPSSRGRRSRARGSPLLRVAEQRAARITTGRNFRPPTEAEWKRAARGDHEGSAVSLGKHAPAVVPRLCRSLRRPWKTGPEPGGQADPTQRALQHVRQRPRVVPRLVSRPMTTRSRPSAIPAARKPGDSSRSSRGGSWRHHIKDVPLRRPLQHPWRVPVRRLRFSRSLRC